MAARLSVLLALLTLAVPPAALAQSNPFAPIPQAPPDTTPTVQQPTSNTTSDNGSLSTVGEIALYGAGALLLFGMGWLIVRDARRRAPIEERVSQPTGTHSPRRHARARQKAKAARAQRKRNRAKR